MFNILRDFFYLDESGLSAVEYIVAGVLIVVLLASGFTLLGISANSYLTVLNDAMDWE